MILTSSNYHSREANQEYMSASQFKSFCQCEAATMAELRGEYVRPTSASLLVGSYVDAHFEGTLDLFVSQHPELFTRTGTLKAEYKKANEIIARCEEDELFMLLMGGKKQVIKTGTIEGVPFKIKIDSLLDAAQVKEIADKFPETVPFLGMMDGLIVDGKVMKDLNPVWKDGEKKPFVEAWGYDIQGAIYQEIDGNMLPFALAVATKETTPDIAAIIVPDDALEVTMDIVKSMAPYYQDIKRGIHEPIRCEKCDYCKATRKLQSFVPYWEVGEDD